MKHDDIHADAVQAYALFLSRRDDGDFNEFDAFAYSATDFAIRRIDRMLRVPPVKPKREPLFRFAGFWARLKGFE
jgi:hypothetical protein